MEIEGLGENEKPIEIVILPDMKKALEDWIFDRFNERNRLGFGDPM